MNKWSVSNQKFTTFAIDFTEKIFSLYVYAYVVK